MESWDDRRAQSVQVGAILLLGVILMAIALYQLQGVPGEVRSMEFQHDQAVEGELLELRNAIERTGSAGGSNPVGIELGVTYPHRPVFLMPPPATGELTTTEPRELRIENARALEANASDFWTGAPKTFETRSIRYAARYNEFHDAPERYVEHGVVVADHDDAVLFRTDGAVVDGDRIDLTVVSGELDTSSAATRTVDPRAISTGTRVVPITGAAGEDVELVLPTAVDGDADALEARWREAVGDDADVTVEDGRVRLVLDGEETYRLRLSKVTVGERTAGSEPPAYVTRVSSEGRTVTAEVRDRFNNPVPAAPVDVYHGDALVDATRTDAQGRVSTSRPEGGTVHVTIDGAEPSVGSRSPLVATADLPEPVDPGTTFDVAWDLESMAERDGVEVSGANALTVDGVDRLEGVVTVRAGGEPVDGVAVELSSANRAVAAPIGSPATTDEDGVATRDLRLSPGETRLFASAGDDADALTIVVADHDGAGGLANGRASDLVANEVQRQTFEIELGADLEPGETVTIDLEVVDDGVPYPFGQASYDVERGSGSVSRVVSAGTVTAIEYESAGDDRGETIRLAVDDVAVGDVAGAEYPVTIESGGERLHTSFVVSDAGE